MRNIQRAKEHPSQNNNNNNKTSKTKAKKAKFPVRRDTELKS